MRKSRQRWGGVDVGAAKGFDLAVIDRGGLVAGPRRLRRAPEAVRWLEEQRPGVVAVDSPAVPALDGHLSRRGERELVRARICGIRYTPDRAALARNTNYYAWIAHGFELFEALRSAEAEAGWRVIECFPTATWSRLGGPREHRTRAEWSRQALGQQALDGLPARLSQDARDAIGAALTGRLYEEGRTEQYEEIVVPVP
jgi:predicted nuclease with RNAse H fold